MAKSLADEKLQLEIRRLRAQAEEAEIERDMARREFDEESATSERNRILNFFGSVNGASVAEAIVTLRYWSRRDQFAPVEIVFNSPGGSVIDGLALYDELLDLRNKGCKIKTVARGMAASMGGILLQAGDERVIGRNAHVLIHEVSTLGMGKLSEIEDEIKFTKGQLQDRLLDILVERSTMTKAQVQRRWKRRDWWLGAEEVVKLGFADRIG